MSHSNTSKARVQEAGQRLYAGIDLALEKNVVVVINEAGQVADRFQFSQDRAGYEYFEQRLERLRQREQAGTIEVAMEPTNYLWKLLAQELEAKQAVYHLVNAYTVKKHREGNQLDRSKDDQRDAPEIAELARQGQCTQTRLQQGVYADLRQFASLYWQVRRAIQREKTIVCGLVGEVFPEFFRVFQKASGETARAVLQSGVAAVEIRQRSLEAFVAGVRAAYPGRRLQLTKLRRLHARAATSIGVSQGVEAIDFALRLHLEILATLSHQGRPHLRTLLYYVALQLIGQDAHFIQLYFHFQRRSTNPLTRMQALGVWMNKLLHLCWALIQQHTLYQPDFSPTNV